MISVKGLHKDCLTHEILFSKDNDTLNPNLMNSHLQVFGSTILILNVLYFLNEIHNCHFMHNLDGHFILLRNPSLKLPDKIQDTS